LPWFLRPALLIAASTLAACASDLPAPYKDTGDTASPSEDPAICDGVQQPSEVTVDAPFDLDGDGFFDGSNPDCVAAWDAAQLDCDDGNAAVHPGATEVCNGVDDDCDGAVDDGAIDATTWFADADSDGYGDPSEPELACDEPAGASAQAGDCDDANAAVNPAAAEVCNGQDDDCDTLVDDDDADLDLSTADSGYLDLDGDGFGDAASPVTACDLPADAVADATDCDDTDPDVYPGAVEVWYDGVDANCNGDSDYDADGDGVDAEGYGGTDCDDTDPSITEDCGPASVCLSFNDTGSASGSTMGGPGLTLGMQFVAPTAMTVTSIEVYTGDATGLNSIGVWSHDPAINAPDAVLRDGSWTMVSTPSWQGATLTTPLALSAGTTYWVGWEPINGALASLADAGSDLSYRGSFDAGATWNGPYTAPWMFRIYCTP
jgi:hypothetical protein